MGVEEEGSFWVALRAGGSVEIVGVAVQRRLKERVLN